METRIGEVLRGARQRREIELSEVETATRIRPRFLRAIEDEEWDVLPGGVYTRGFIRTYASFLGLDGERLAEDYRREVEGHSREWTPAQEGMVTGSSAPGAGVRGRGWRIPAPGWFAALSVAVVAVLVIVLLPIGGGGGGGGKNVSGNQASGRETGGGIAKRGRPPTTGVSVRLAASAEVWVCVLDAKGRHLVDGQILEEGAEAGPFHSDSFTVSFGNGEVAMTVDGKQAEIPATSSPIGYSIDASGRLVELSESERPTCT